MLPSIAVHLELLDLVRSIFLNMAPNNTAWCEILEGLLRERGYKLDRPVRFILNVRLVDY